MTIAVAVRTGSAVVFATDSKLTARGMTGINPDGTPNWVDQSYDHATKVVHDRSKRLMALVAGTVNVGRTTAIDLIASFSFRECANRDEEDDAIMELLDHMNAQKHAFWSQTGAPPDEWPGPTLVLATPSRAEAMPRVWSVSMSGAAYQHREVLMEPNLLLEGSYMEVFALLYGLHLDMVNALVLRMTPEPEILAYPGKTLHHPHATR